jgi:hypothetical protein
MRITLHILPILACVSSQALADFPSTFEFAGLLDASIKVCGEVAPSKAEYYKQLILTSMSCGKPISELEKILAEIRESKNPGVQAAYQRYFNKTLDSFNVTEKQKLELCEKFSQVKC